MRRGERIRERTGAMPREHQGAPRRKPAERCDGRAPDWPDLPVQYAAIREGLLKNDSRKLVFDGVEQVLRDYERACQAEPAGCTVSDRGSE